MRPGKTTWIILIVLAIGIKIFSLFPEAVERYYSAGIYPVISKFQRILFGWIPFSIGDLFYGVVILLLIYKVIDFIKRLFKRKFTREYWLTGLRRLVFIVLLVYVAFNLFWGLNYNRQGIAWQLGLKVDTYSKEDLVTVMQEMVIRLNTLEAEAKQNRQQLFSKRNLFREAVHSYKILGSEQPDFKYNIKSVKPSLYSYLGNYLGYTGYYNPFSGEAQVNTTVPIFIQPYTTCHEMGHQLGYAKENEANFAGYLSAKSSRNASFRYSVYFDLYSYSRFYLYIQDSAMLKQLDSQLTIGVKKDYRELRKFLLKHRNPVEKVIDNLYGQYLKANQQPSGRLTYNEVIAWLVAYYKKFGKEAI